VDLYSGCDSDETSNEIVGMEKRYYCEIIAFLSRRYYRFWFVLLSDFDGIFYDFRWQLLSNGSDIAKKLK
jgi:hypothetical protein